MNEKKSLLNLKSMKEEEMNLERLKRHFRRELEKHEIRIAEELSENLLKEIFLKTKERIKNETKYKLEEMHFPKDHLFAWLICEGDWGRFLTCVFLSQSENESEKTEQSWKEEYAKEKPAFEEKIRGVKSIIIPISSKTSVEPNFFFIGLSSKKTTSLEHELTHYFEIKLNLSIGSLEPIIKG